MNTEIHSIAAGILIAAAVLGPIKLGASLVGSDNTVSKIVGFLMIAIFLLIGIGIVASA